METFKCGFTDRPINRLKGRVGNQILQRKKGNVKAEKHRRNAYPKNGNRGYQFCIGYSKNEKLSRNFSTKDNFTLETTFEGRFCIRRRTKNIWLKSILFLIFVRYLWHWREKLLNNMKNIHMKIVSNQRFSLKNELNFLRSSWIRYTYGFLNFPWRKKKSLNDKEIFSISSTYQTTSENPVIVFRSNSLSVGFSLFDDAEFFSFCCSSSCDRTLFRWVVLQTNGIPDKKNRQRQ